LTSRDEGVSLTMPVPGSEWFTLGWQTHADKANFAIILNLLFK